uniref:Glycosyltransferase n=1 Tax=viral metagenome TaxID=1070528 RepID=A0A6M3J1N2_9ZZZZ
MPISPDEALARLKEERQRRQSGGGGTPRVAVVTPMSWSHTPKVTHMALETLRMKHPTIATFYPESDTIGAMRNLGVRKVRKVGGFTHILFCDADMTWGHAGNTMAEDPLGQLLAHKVDVVGGLCRSRHSPFACTLWEHRDDHYERVPPVGFGLVRYAATGGAFLLVRMEVFDELDKEFIGWPYFINRQELIVNGEPPPELRRQLSEDLYFCEQVGKLGIPIYVDLDCRIGHVVTAIVSDDAKHNVAISFPKGED